jgi:glutathione synthase/RimK-type ligase-like ATP-grasp enzyme
VKAAIALVSARAARALDEDMAPLLAAFAAAGAHAEIADWDDAGVEWSRFDVALLRSTWDYTERLGEFLAWVTRVSCATLLLNPAPVVRWNSDKHYLLELERAGVPVVPSSFAEAGADPGAVLEGFLARERCAELVVKPAVGAGSRATRRHARTSTAAAREHIAQLLNARRSVLLQPYLASVDRDGETALIYIAGRFSHAIRKGALLPPQAAATQALFATEDIRPRTAQPDELAVGERALAALPAGPLLYARVDLIRDANGSPCLLELELAEPSLFLAQAADAAQRLAEATLAARAARHGSRR